MIKSSEFIHPEDAVALRQLESIPGFMALSRKAMELGYENYKYGLNMASSIRLSPTQLPELYNRLPPICNKLGMHIPEFYLEMKLKPNAATSGVKRTYIRMTSGLVEYMDDEGIETLLAHECGHLICNHNLYRVLIEYIREFPDVGNLFSKPMLYALMYWYRKSELSSDRCASLITSPEAVIRVMSHFSGGPKSLLKDLNMDDWIKQADDYEKIKNGGLWNKALQWYITMERSHPFDVVRVNEILKWGRTEQYKTLKSKMQSKSSNRVCENCRNSTEPDWKFCKYCGTKI
jgi:Zn-dependent protease with chaperone function